MHNVQKWQNISAVNAVRFLGHVLIKHVWPFFSIMQKCVRQSNLPEVIKYRII